MHNKFHAMTGMHHVGQLKNSNYEFDTRHARSFAGMTDEEMREFLREEQKEGMHPSLKGKRF